MPPDRKFAALGWVSLGRVPGLRGWVDAVRPVAAALAAAEAGGPRRCGGTWYAGVNILPNGPDGALPGGPALPKTLTASVARITGFAGWAWEPAQISVCYPGYPQLDPGETAAAYRYRRDRDAAHLDGLLPEGSERRRHLREQHAFILGIPLVETDPDAAPLIVHEGSHKTMREGFSALFEGCAPDRWGDVDATEVYQALRRAVFTANRRRKLHARPGEAYLLHRLCLHGVAPWTAAVEPQKNGAPHQPLQPPKSHPGRMIAYFRPEPAADAPPGWWLGP